MKPVIALLLAACAVLVSGQFNPNFAPGRSVIVHMFEWKYKDIAEECELHLGPEGIGGIQISPPTENLIVDYDHLPRRPWWERYQPISYKLTTRSGNGEELQDMIKRCNKVGVRTYPDLVLNHMTKSTIENQRGTGGSTADAEKRDYPGVPYRAEHFHNPICAITNRDYQNPRIVRECELEHLRDLNQTLVYVQEQAIALANNKYFVGIAGMRIDAPKHMLPENLAKIYEGFQDCSTEHGFAPGTRPYIYQEVIDLGLEPIKVEHYKDFGAVTEFSYGAELGRVFKGKDELQHLKNFGEGWGLFESKKAFVFIDNHDNQRGHGAKSEDILTHKEPKRYKMATGFALAHPYGTVQIMSSYYFENNDQGPPHDENFNILSRAINPDGSCGNGWVCEHRWRQIINMVSFRNIAGDAPIKNWWSDGYHPNHIAFSRGDKAFAAWNNDEHHDLKQELQTGLPPGKYCDIVSGKAENNKCTGHTISVKPNGHAYIEIKVHQEDGFMAIHVGPKSRLVDLPKSESHTNLKRKFSNSAELPEKKTKIN